jgi:hypothetical protein
VLLRQKVGCSILFCSSCNLETKLQSELRTLWIVKLGDERKLIWKEQKRKFEQPHPLKFFLSRFSKKKMKKKLKTANGETNWKLCILFWVSTIIWFPFLLKLSFALLLKKILLVWMIKRKKRIFEFWLF